MTQTRIGEHQAEEDSRGGPLDALIGGTALVAAAVAPAAPEGSTFQKVAIAAAAVGAIVLSFRMR